MYVAPIAVLAVAVNFLPYAYITNQACVDVMSNLSGCHLFLPILERGGYRIICQGPSLLEYWLSVSGKSIVEFRYYRCGISCSAGRQARGHSGIRAPCLAVRVMCWLEVDRFTCICTQRECKVGSWLSSIQLSSHVCYCNPCEI